MDAGNVAEMMTALTDAAGKTDEITRNITGIYKKMFDLEMDSAESYKQGEKDAALISKTAGDAMLAGQAATMLDKRKLAIDTPEAMSLRTENLNEFVSRKREADARLAEIKDISSVGFLDDPLGYITGQLKLPTLIQQYNITGMQANSALRTVNDIDQTLTAAAQQNKVTAETLNDAAVGAAARQASLQYKILADDKQYKALSANIMANQIVDHGNKEQISYLMKQYEILKNEESLKRHNEQLAMERQRFQIYMQEHGDKIAAKQRLRETILLGMGALKLPKPDEGTLAAFEEDYKTPEGRARMQYILDAGNRLRYSGIATFGVTPGEAADTLRKVGDRTAGTELEPVAKVIGKEIQALIRQGADPRKPDTFIPLINQSMDKVMKSANADPENGGSLIYKAPSVQRMAQNDYVANTEWFKKILGPSVAAASLNNTTVPDIPATKLYEMTVDAVKKGDIKLEQAVEGISTYYKAAGQINAIRNGQLGIAPQNGYKVNTGYSMFGGGDYDLSNPVQVTNAIIAKLSMQNPEWGYVGEALLRHVNPLQAEASKARAAEKYGAIYKPVGE